MCVPQDDGCGGQAVMEERLMMQQQQMEDDQRWLEQEESFMVMVMVLIDWRQPSLPYVDPYYEQNIPSSWGVWPKDSASGAAWQLTKRTLASCHPAHAGVFLLVCLWEVFTLSKTSLRIFFLPDELENIIFKSLNCFRCARFISPDTERSLERSHVFAKQVCFSSLFGSDSFSSGLKSQLTFLNQV